METIIHSMWEARVKLETVDEDMVMDIEPARGGYMNVMEPRE